MVPGSFLILMGASYFGITALLKIETHRDVDTLVLGVVLVGAGLFVLGCFGRILLAIIAH